MVKKKLKKNKEESTNFSFFIYYNLFRREKDYEEFYFIANTFVYYEKHERRKNVSSFFNKILYNRSKKSHNIMLIKKICY